MGHRIRLYFSVHKFFSRPVVLFVITKTVIHLDHHQASHEEKHGRKWSIVIDQNEYSWKDNLIEDFYDNWSIEKTCDTVTLESSHSLPLNQRGMFYTYECKDDEIAYFKVDLNLIELNHLGNDWDEISKDLITVRPKYDGTSTSVCGLMRCHHIYSDYIKKTIFSIV